MKQLIVFAPPDVELNFLEPFIFTRRVQDFRVGALTIREKWERLLALPSVDLKDDRLSSFFPSVLLQDIDDNTVKYVIASNLLPAGGLLQKVRKLLPGQSLVAGDGRFLAGCMAERTEIAALQPVEKVDPVHYNWLDFFYRINTLNNQALRFDIDLLRGTCKGQLPHVSNGLTGSDDIFIEEGAVVRHAILNAEEGPIFIAKNAQVMEGACLRGPLYIGENAVVKMGAAIYGATTIGPNCVIGGEVKNSVFFANSNKGHDGYVGDSVIGEWCNFGAGTSCSNMKNNVGDVNYRVNDTFVVTGMKKGGVMMGDYSRTAINTAINTGTMVGVSAHVFGTGLTPKAIPDFSWGYCAVSVQDDSKTYPGRPVKYDLQKCLRDADSWKQLKGQNLSDIERNILTELYNKR